MAVHRSRLLNICVVTQQINRVVSGVGLHARNLVGSLCADGHRVTVIAPLDQRPAGDPGYRFIGVPRPWLSQNQARWFSLSLSFARALTQSHRQEGYDLVHFTDGREALFSRLTIPILGNVNDTYSADTRSLGYYRLYYDDWMDRWAYYHFVHLCEASSLPHLNAVLANSQYTAGIIQKKYHLKPEKLHVIYKSIDADHYLPALGIRAKNAPQAPRVLFVGGNMQRKGLPTLIQAAPLVAKAIPQVEFWVVGKDPAVKKMIKLCEDQGVTPRFRFWGLVTQENLLDIYANSDIFVMPSLTESFGVVFLEAMASGLPVIGANTGGIPEIIENGSNGLLVEPDAITPLANAMITLLTDKILWNKMSQAGLVWAKEFSIRRMMEQTYEVYERISRTP